jgi:dihydroneopterin aldolase
MISVRNSRVLSAALEIAGKPCQSLRKLKIGKPMDIVYISDLRVETIIGIYDWERKIRQIVSIDLEMAADNRKAAATESIDDALNYKAVAKRLIQFAEESEFQLVETLAERIAEIILEEFDVDWLRLKLGKPGAVTGSREVGVIIERGERS